VEGRPKWKALRLNSKMWIEKVPEVFIGKVALINVFYFLAVTD